MNSSTETISANLEVAEDDAITWLFFPGEADRERRGNRYDVFTSEDFRLRPVIGHKIIFTREKNRPTSQIASSFQKMIFICQIML